MDKDPATWDLNPMFLEFRSTSRLIQLCTWVCVIVLAATTFMSGQTMEKNWIVLTGILTFFLIAHSAMSHSLLWQANNLNQDLLFSLADEEEESGPTPIRTETSLYPGQRFSTLDDLVDPLSDPWEVQRDLMIRSGQETPGSPTLTSGSLLYLALIMEELAETLQAADKVLSGTTYGQHLDIPAAGLLHSSQRIRQSLKLNPQVYIPLTGDQAVELLDGTTDIAVTNCGFCVATGLPGGAAYREVARSNLSKVNPETGVIDKTPDGKWIKGSGFTPPDLAKVL